MGVKTFPAKQKPDISTINTLDSAQRNQKEPTGRFKQWKAKSINFCRKILLKIGNTFSSRPVRNESFHAKKIMPSNNEVVSDTLDTHKKNPQENKVQRHAIRKALEKRPTTIEESRNTLRTLESMQEVLKESPSSKPVLLEQVNDRIKVLTKSLITSNSSYNACQLKLLYTRSALDLILKKTGSHTIKLEAELESRIQELENNAEQASKIDQITNNEMAAVAKEKETLVKTLNKTGLKVTAKNLKNSIVEHLNAKQWHQINNTGSVIGNGNIYHFQEQCTPACEITQQPNLIEKGDSDPKKNIPNIFPEDYQGKGVTSHATKNTIHATNLFTSKIINNESNKEDFAAVRHGTLSPYGLKQSKERKDGAINRAKEVVLSALSLKPELLERACQGEAVNLMMTSCSLLTPDPFRGVVRPESDEKPMVKDQIDAFKALSYEKPLTLMMKTADGNPREIRINIDIIPFNFGVNSFAVNSKFDKIGGWEYSDSINNKGIQTLMGSTTPDVRIGGIAGKWLNANESHPNAPLVRVLVKQIQEIYSSQAHRTLKGGAYKLVSRLNYLTWLMGGIPCTNCKSGKDRTSESILETHALVAHHKLYKKVPKWKETSKDQSYLVKEFSLKGPHHEIQKLNVGAPGFKVQTHILKEQGMNKEEMAQIIGFSSIT